MKDKLQRLLELSPKVNEKQKEILLLKGKNFGDKIRNYILINYFGMKDNQKRGLIGKFKERTAMFDKTCWKMTNGKGLDEVTLLRIFIGVGLNLVESIAIFDFYGYSLKGPHYQKEWNTLLKLENEKFMELSFDDRLELTGLDRLCKW